MNDMFIGNDECLVMEWQPGSVLVKVYSLDGNFYYLGYDEAGEYKHYVRVIDAGDIDHESMCKDVEQIIVEELY